MHNVLFGQYGFLPTEQAQTYLKIYVLIYHTTNICPSLFSWKAGVESEGGGEDERGEGNAVGDQDDWEITIATWADNSELDSRGFV